MYICYIKDLEIYKSVVLTVGDDELIVGNDELDVGDSEVTSSEVAKRNDALEGLQATWTRDPMNRLWFKIFNNQFVIIISVFYSLIRFE